MNETRLVGTTIVFTIGAASDCSPSATVIKENNAHLPEMRDELRLFGDSRL